MLQKLILLACISLISGCSDSNIELVKKSTNHYWEDYTVSQLLDNREQCEEVDWKSFADKNERVIVEYNCKLIPATEIIKNQIINARPNNKKLEDKIDSSKYWQSEISQRANERIKILEQEIQNNPEFFKNNHQYIEDIQRDINQRVEEYNKVIERDTHQHKLEQKFSDITAENFEGVYESHQWVIKNGHPSFQGSFMTYKVKDEEDYSPSYDPREVYKTAVEDSQKANFYLDYTIKQQWWSIYNKRLNEYMKHQP